MNEPNITTERKDILDHNYIGVFTDGSSFIGKDKSFYEASSGYIIVINDVPVFRCGFYHKNGTNSIGEVYAMSAAIEKVEEIKRDNPELKDYFTFYMSDSQYVIKSLTEYILSWRKQGNKVWKTSTGEVVAYQSIFKYILNTYLNDDKWYLTNVFLHIKGHLDTASHKKKFDAFKKMCAFNSRRLSFKRRSVKWDSFNELILYNRDVDEIADSCRLNKTFYFEEVMEGTKWQIRKNPLPKRNQRIVIRSRNGSKS